MKQSKKRLMASLAIVLSVVLLVGIWSLTNNVLKQQNVGDDLIQAVVCDFNKAPCKATRGEQQIIFAIEAETVASFVPLNFRVQLVGFAADSVAIDFQGVDMFMGINKLDLKLRPDGSYADIRTLPGHIDHAMVWRAKVFIHQDETVAAGWFDFEAK
jgi:hypothetical protein